jgi:HlyD family secretion protein
MTRENAVDNRMDPFSGGAEAPAEIAGLPPVVLLPAVLPPEPGPRSRRRLRCGLLFLVLLPALLGGGYWWFRSGPILPPGIVFGNGRLEADEIDIDTKFAGRIAKIFVDEDDIVQADQVVAMMDTPDLAATLKKNEALVDEARRTLDEAKANLAQ